MHHIAEPAHHSGQLVALYRPLSGHRHPPQPALGLGLARLFLTDPSGDHGGVGAGLQCGTVLGELAITFGNLPPGRGDPLRLWRQYVLDRDEGVKRLGDVMGSEQSARARISSAWEIPGRAFGEVLDRYDDAELALIADYLPRAAAVGRAQAERLTAES
ncbi:hypothetical protein [Sphaerisporangium perillae]|uniref:hypothetical protein n=1 Tax=Sphaerisporangium perillae TaxID=2935860 RepID=UPI002010BBB0|nr:hypothetical protein [Sphaerisporangium perillae]